MFEPCPSLEEIGIAPRPFHPKTIVVDGVLAEECATCLMKEFFKARRIVGVTSGTRSCEILLPDPPGDPHTDLQCKSMYIPVISGNLLYVLRH